MKLTKWNPQGQLSALRREMDHLFDRFLESPFGAFGDAFRHSVLPALDISEDDRQVVVKAELPGMTADDISVNLMDNRLTLKGEKKQEKEEKDTHFHRIERSYGSFHRVLDLPASIDKEKVSARYDNGVLEITMPKLESEEARQVSILVK